MAFDGLGVSPTLAIWNISVDQVWRRAVLMECANILRFHSLPQDEYPPAHQLPEIESFWMNFPSRRLDHKLLLFLPLPE